MRVISISPGAQGAPLDARVVLRCRRGRRQRNQVRAWHSVRSQRINRYLFLSKVGEESTGRAGGGAERDHEEGERRH